MKKIILLIILNVLALKVIAGGTVGYQTLGEIKIQEQGIRITAKDGMWKDVDQCSGTNEINRVYLSIENPIFNELFSALLSLKISNQDITFYVSECISVHNVNYPLVTVLYIR